MQCWQKRGNTKSKDRYKQTGASQSKSNPADAPARVGNSTADNKTEGAAECGRCSVIGSTEGNQLCDWMMTVDHIAPCQDHICEAQETSFECSGDHVVSQPCLTHPLPLEAQEEASSFLCWAYCIVNQSNDQVMHYLIPGPMVETCNCKQRSKGVLKHLHLPTQSFILLL